jgi:hypothetical protein
MKSNSNHFPSKPFKAFIKKRFDPLLKKRFRYNP